jgi:hypothetical protein
MPDTAAALRDLVRSRAAGLCEYCRIPEQQTLAEHEIDHVIALKHGGQTIEDNLALCCAICNRYKGSDIASIDPDTGVVTALYHPRRNVWQEHFEVRGAEIFGSSACGRATVRLLRMNQPARLRERKIPSGW